MPQVSYICRTGKEIVLNNPKRPRFKYALGASNENDALFKTYKEIRIASSPLG